MKSIYILFYLLCTIYCLAITKKRQHLSESKIMNDFQAHLQFQQVTPNSILEINDQREQFLNKSYEAEQKQKESEDIDDIISKQTLSIKGLASDIKIKRKRTKKQDHDDSESDEKQINFVQKEIKKESLLKSKNQKSTDKAQLRSSSKKNKIAIDQEQKIINQASNFSSIQIKKNGSFIESNFIKTSSNKSENSSDILNKQFQEQNKTQNSSNQVSYQEEGMQDIDIQAGDENKKRDQIERLKHSKLIDLGKQSFQKLTTNFTFNFLGLQTSQSLPQNNDILIDNEVQFEYYHHNLAQDKKLKEIKEKQQEEVGKNAWLFSFTKWAFISLMAGFLLMMLSYVFVNATAC